MKSIFLIFIAFILTSCSNPGYSIRIYVNKGAGATENDLKLIRNYLLMRPYDVVMVKEKDCWKVESYKINLNEKKFEGAEHRYISFAIEYYYNNEKDNEKKVLDKIEVRIGNSWEGRNPVLKAEIDKAANYIMNQLMQRFDSSYLSIDRRYTGPM